MILDNLKNIETYNLNDNFKTAVKFINENDLNLLPIGKTEIDGKNVYVSVSEYQTKHEVGEFEVHNNYADIQIILSGKERMDWCERKDCFTTIDYNQEKDVEKVNTNNNFSQLKVAEGQFALFFPNDAHSPNLTDGNQGLVKKAVIKVKL